MSSRPTHPVRTALGRGLRKRCPHCGQGALFQGREHLTKCAVCGLVYERNQGDTWMFTIIGDRIPIAVMIAVIFFGIGRAHRVLMVMTFCVLSGLIVWTAQNRWGLGIALHYLSRVYWPESADPIPPPYE